MIGCFAAPRFSRGDLGEVLLWDKEAEGGGTMAAQKERKKTPKRTEVSTWTFCHKETPTPQKKKKTKVTKISGLRRNEITSLIVNEQSISRMFIELHKVFIVSLLFHSCGLFFQVMFRERMEKLNKI